MARRRRLNPGQSNGQSNGQDDDTARDPVAIPRTPIAAIAGEIASAAALDVVSRELHEARTGGRMVVRVPLDAILRDHLIRDRLEDTDDSEDMDALTDSLARRGQQSPVELTDLGGGRFGLISGARRIAALERLAKRTGTPGEALALIRRPADMAEAYVAMVEENEIRADLSFYERARIVVRALQAGVFDDPKAALQGLFGAVSFSKRSKIKSFMAVVEALDGALRFPARLSERQGLALARVLGDDPEAGATLRAALTHTPPETPEAEAALLAAACAPPKKPGMPAQKTPPKADPDSFLIAPGIRILARRGHVELSGEGVNPGLIERLQDFLRTQT